MSDTLVHYLREARAMEAGLAQILRGHATITPQGMHRARIEEHVEETRAHERRLAARLDELGWDGEDPLRQVLSMVSAPIGFGLGIARGAARTMLSVLGMPLALLHGPEAPERDRVLRNVRSEAASEALEIATYTAIERLAAAEGDEQTEFLAAQIRQDEERMLEYLRGAAASLADALAGGGAQVAGSRSQEPPPAPEPEPPDLEPETSDLEQPQTSDLRPQTSAHVSEEPELVAEVSDPGAEEPAGAEVEVQEPWEGYDGMSAAEIERRLEGASDEVAAVVRLYEAAGKSRRTVLRAAERRLHVS
jgi:ferritin-like metal-binding protein YciE